MHAFTHARFHTRCTLARLCACTHVRTPSRTHAFTPSRLLAFAPSRLRTFTHARTHACTHARLHACLRTHTFTHAHTHAFSHARLHKCLNAFTHACMRVRTCLHACTCKHTCAGETAYPEGLNELKEMTPVLQNYRAYLILHGRMHGHHGCTHTWTRAVSRVLRTLSSTYTAWHVGHQGGHTMPAPSVNE